MIEFTTSQITPWVMAMFWPFVRILAFVAVAPIFGENSLSRVSKVGLAVLIAFIIAPTLPPPPDIPPVSYVGVWLIVQQVLIGIAMGMVMRVVFATVRAAGDYIGLQMGLGFASFYSAAMGANIMVLAQILNVFALLFFLAFDGHLIMLQVLAFTFVELPIGAGAIEAEGWYTLVRWGGTVFSAGLGLALPLVTALLTINMALGILNRASPQLSIFSIGFPLTLLSGVVLLYFMVPELGGLFEQMFANGIQAMGAVLGAMAGTA
ncbi:flagellar biosynthetic protein FliR [Salinisphaera shabanensis T35B1]|jgi:flagellar biosynthetic protein FliR|uniref:flagellar biosynthetic protein FliR n=1 Tax=Salinisphaera shabanensis TaxID=180542 RepID=UPI003341552B